MPKQKRHQPAIVIESKGGVLYNEFSEVVPAEFKAKSREERKKEQEEAWAEFDRELGEKIRMGEFGVNPETKEIAQKKVRTDG